MKNKNTGLHWKLPITVKIERVEDEIPYFTSLLVKHKIDNNEDNEQRKNELLDMLNKEKLNYTTYSSNPTLKNEITGLHKINIEHMISKISKICNDTFSKLPNMTDEEFRETFNTNLNKKIEEYNIKNMFTGIIISLDWDDVIYHLMQKNIEFVEKEYGIKDVHNEITDYYYLYRTYPKIADELWNHPENYISADLVNGAKEFYQELVNLVGEDKIQIVTSSMENVIPLKDKMIRERFGINCKIVHSIFGKHKKYEFTKDTLLIDDFVGNIKEHYIHNLNYGIVFNHMNLDYIKKESEEEGFVHVTTFKEVIESVKKYLEFGKDYLPNVEYCPYCEKDLYNLKFQPYITTTECPHCKNTIVLEQEWICDPKCQSDGMTIYYLYTLEDAKKLEIEIEE